MSRSKELREERHRIVTQAQELLNKPGKRTAEENAAFDAAMAAADVLKTDIDRYERADTVDAEIRAAVSQTQVVVSDDPEKVEEKRSKAYRAAFLDYLRNGDVAKPWQRGMAETSRKLLLERRAATDQSAGSQTITYTAGAAGGYFVPAGFVQEVDIATKYFCPMIDGSVCRLLETATGNVLPYPTSNDTANLAAVLAENAQETENPLTMGVVTFGAYKYSSRLIRVSLELLQDSAFNIEEFVKQQFALRFGRGYENAFTLGDGNNKPLGFIKAIEESGVTTLVAAGANPNSGISGDTGANSIGTQDLVALEHSIDPTYRRTSKWILNDDTVRELKSLLDKFGRPIWLPGLAVNAPDVILGYPYVVNQSMDKVGAGKKTLAFGDWQKFVIRKVRELSVIRLDERFADFGQVAFLGFTRVDSKLVDAGTHPLNLMKQAS